MKAGQVGAERLRPGVRSRLLPRAIPALAWVVAMLLVSGRVAAQERTLTGVVVDAQTLRPLSGAQVVVAGTERGGLTNVNGRFLITGATGDEVTLQVIMIGYRTVERTVRVGDPNIRIELTESAVELDEIVVTGTPGGAQVRAIGNAVAKVKAEDLVEIAPPPDIQAMLSPNVPGLRFMRASGDVGTGGVTRIRGPKSMALTGEPLIYVDGIRVDNEKAASGSAFRDGERPSRINDFGPEEIERIEVIKGPAAATLYGTEASNGVIQIFTKRGRTGEPTFDFSVEQGATYLPSPEERFQPVYGLDQAGKVFSFSPLTNDRELGLPPVFTTGHNQGYNLSMRGGVEKFRYFLSGGFERQEGFVSYNWKNRANYRANLTYVQSEKLQFDGSLGLVQSRARAANVQQPITSSIIWADPKKKDGPTRGYGFRVPESYLEVVGIEQLDRMTASLQIKYSPFEWFDHRLTVGSDVGDTRDSGLFPWDPAGSQGPHGAQSRGFKEVTGTRTGYVTVDYAATAAFDVISDVHLSTSVGAQYYRKSIAGHTSRGEVFPAAGVETVSATAIRIGEESFVENKTLGMFVQEQVGWKNRIFLTGALRGDDNSAFGKNFDFVLYPKVSATWVLNEEPWWNLPGVEALKLRAAWGKAGQQPDAFAAARTYRPSVGPGGASTLTPGNVGNPDLEPEVGEELELGFDAGLLNDRLGIEFTYYDQRTKGAIVQKPALPSQGFPGVQFVNIGEVVNSGIELAVNARFLQRPTLNWETTFTLSTNHNEVLDLGGVDPGGGLQRQVVGYPLSSTFMKKIVQAELGADGKATNILCEGGDKVAGGGPPVPCSQAGTAYFGRPTPAWEGSASTSLTLFRNLRLYALVDFVGGHIRRDGDIAAAHLFFYISKEIVTRSDPFVVAYNQLGELWQTGMIEGGFAKLRNVSATYQLPRVWAQRIGADRASMTLAGENLATLWVEQCCVFGRKQVEPEIRSSTSELSDYNQEQFPQPRRLTAAFRVSF